MVKKLIEVSMPVQEIGGESVRDKSIRHGHISTLHLWWARRPLPVSRAVVFASLVPDPDDVACPPAFVAAVNKLLQSPAYKPAQPTPDTPRARLVNFVARYSDAYRANESKGKTTPPKETLADSSLIKWENKNNEAILNIARKLLWVAKDPENNTVEAFDEYYSAIKNAEKKLYAIKDRHIINDEIIGAQTALQQAIEAFQERMPSVCDPFSGGGAIPLEAARLGCKTCANDLNPVAHIIERASLEYPQRYGKPISYSAQVFEQLYGTDGPTYLDHKKGDRKDGGQSNLQLKKNTFHIKNRLAFDVNFYARKLLAAVENRIGHLYPKAPSGAKPVAYLWARTATCSNPMCNAEVPLLRQFYLCNKDKKKVYLNPIIEENNIKFEIKNGKCPDMKGWQNRGNLECPCCANTTPVKEVKKQSVNGELKEKLIAVILEGKDGKEYTLPTQADFNATLNIPDAPGPNEPMPINYIQAMPCCGWGVTQWGQMFSPRQLLLMQTLIEELTALKAELKTQFDKEYYDAICVYLAVWVDRLSSRNTSFGLWHNTGEKLEQPFGRQAIPMVFDYPESNPFCDSGGSALNQLDWIVRYIESESDNFNYVSCFNNISGEYTSWHPKTFDAVVTDPPYYDAIAYADLSDFFYVWLKKTLGDDFEYAFGLKLTPKEEECTALKHHHNNSKEEANAHFENKLLAILTHKRLLIKPDGIVSIMFAHQSAEAWQTLMYSILHANLNIMSSWSFDSEMQGALKTNKLFLESSVTVSCRVRESLGVGNYKRVEDGIRERVRAVVRVLLGYGFRGADLLTACFGPAVGEFGKYDSVEKSDGAVISVSDLLTLARDAAFEAVVSDVEADDVTRFYIGWLNLFGFTTADHDDARRVSQIGLHLDISLMVADGILVRASESQLCLSDFEIRAKYFPQVGEAQAAPLIDKLQKAMWLYEHGGRARLVSFIASCAAEATDPFWRVAVALVEVLPPPSADKKALTGLLASQDSLLKEIKRNEAEAKEIKLF